MVLADLSAKCGMDFTLVHCHFGLRGRESDADAKLVEDRAKQLNKKFLVRHFNTIDYVKQHKVSVQIAARELRYAWFNEIMKNSGTNTLVTAHHADDNLETFLINLSRGTGIDGLTGIPERTDSIARPLLSFSRQQIKTYAETEDIKWREDRSNADTKYLRNNIRHRIVPLLKELNANFLQHFGETQRYLGQTASIADEHIRELKDSLFLKEGEILKIPVKALTGLQPLSGYLYGFFKEYGFTEWNDIEHLLHAMSGKEVRSKSHRLVKDRAFLLLTEINAVNNETYHIQENEAKIEKPVSLRIGKADAISETGAHILYVAKKALKYPLTIRKWRQGDYFYPLGMQGKKKLSKFFKDEKLDVITKQKQWLLCSEGAIVWVVGRRADERFKVSEASDEILKFELK